MSLWLGVDYGLERWGVAISAPDENMVFPLCTLVLASFHNRAGMLNKLVELAMQHRVSGLVIGLPLHENGDENLTCSQVRNIVKRIKRRLPSLSFYFMPELLSSYEAAHDLRACGCYGKRFKAALDQVAACRILESFLAQPPGHRNPA